MTAVTMKGSCGCVWPSISVSESMRMVIVEVSLSSVMVKLAEEPSPGQVPEVIETLSITIISDS